MYVAYFVDNYEAHRCVDANYGGPVTDTSAFFTFLLARQPRSSEDERSEATRL